MAANSLDALRSCARKEGWSVIQLKAGNNTLTSRKRFLVISALSKKLGCRAAETFSGYHLLLIICTPDTVTNVTRCQRRAGRTPVRNIFLGVMVGKHWGR